MSATVIKNWYFGPLVAKIGKCEWGMETIILTYNTWGLSSVCGLVAKIWSVDHGQTTD